MNNTVVGVFDRVESSEQAVEELLNSGFSGYDIDVSRNKATTAETETEGKSGIKKFFDSLFGDEEQESQRYSEAARKGCVITVHTDTKEEARKAAEILDSCGAIDPNGNYINENKFSGSDYKGSDINYNKDSGSNFNTGIVDTSLYPENDNILNTTSDADALDLEKDRYKNNPGLDINARPLANDNLADENFIGASTGNTNYTNNDEDFNSINNEKSIPVIEENMEIGKREVETNEVRVRSRIFEKPVEENLRLRSEFVHIERTPVNRTATPADLENFKEGVIEMKETEEVPLIKKEAKVVEEVKIKKEAENKEQTIRGSVRRQDVDVERNKKSKQTSNEEDADLF